MTFSACIAGLEGERECRRKVWDRAPRPNFSPHSCFLSPSPFTPGTKANIFGGKTDWWEFKREGDHYSLFGSVSLSNELF